MIGPSLRQFRIIAHRGASAHELENSFSAFHMAFDMHADMIELDVRRTKDHRVVVMHDPKINRVAKGKGIVEKMTFDHLRNFKLKNGEPIPTLEETLELAKGRCKLNVEIKVKNIEKEVADLIQKHGMYRSVIVSSFYPDILRNVKKHNPSVRIALICNRFTEKNVELARDLGCYSIHPNNRNLSPSIVAYAHVNQMKVYTWTINSTKELPRLLKISVDGIFTDSPDNMRDFVKKLRSAKFRNLLLHRNEKRGMGYLGSIIKKPFSKLHFRIKNSN